MANAFKVGDLVWAKMKGFPPWPGLVSEPPDSKKINEKKPKYYIFFFGSENYAWVAFDNMSLYLEKREEYVAMLRPTHSFQEAVDAIDDYVREHGGTIPVTPKKSPTKQPDTAEDESGSGRRNRKRPSTMESPAAAAASRSAGDGKAVKRESEKKRRDSSGEKKKEEEEEEEVPKKKSDLGVMKKLSGDDDDDEDDAAIELKSKRISRKRNDDEEEEEEEGVGHDDDPVYDAGVVHMEVTKEKEAKKAATAVATTTTTSTTSTSTTTTTTTSASTGMKGTDECGEGEEEEEEDEEVEKMLVDEETEKKLKESKGSDGVGGGEEDKLQTKKEAKGSNSGVGAGSSSSISSEKVDKTAVVSKVEQTEKTKRQTKTPVRKTREDTPSTKKKQNGVAAVVAKRKSAAVVDKKSETLAKKTYLPDVLPSTTTKTSTSSSSSSVNKKLSSIIPTSKKIGFIGCGSVGSRLLENLLASRHQVLLWNRTASKCKHLYAKGASKCLSPSDVTKKADVIITCLSDAVAFKDVVYGSNGVLQAMTEGKGLVNLTTMDVETTLDACEAVTSRGGSFLEVAMLGSLDSATEGDLLLLVSGDQALYATCSSLFKAVSKNIFNMVDMGTATKMQVVFNSLYGTTISGLAEGLSLASKVGIDPAEVLEVVSHTSVMSSLIRTKGEAMVKNNLHQVGIKLDTLQRNIRLAISMSEEVDQPLHVGSVVNELFKKAKAKGYGDCDVAAVYRATDL